jgi:hypothetical protein
MTIPPNHRSWFLVNWIGARIAMLAGTEALFSLPARLREAPQRNRMRQIRFM